MYREYKGDDVVGPARIGRVMFTKTGKSIDYKGRRFTVMRLMEIKCLNQFRMVECQANRVFGRDLSHESDPHPVFNWFQSMKIHNALSLGVLS